MSDFEEWYDNLEETKKLHGLTGLYKIKNHTPKENTWCLMMKALAKEAWDYQQEKLNSLGGTT